MQKDPKVLDKEMFTLYTNWRQMKEKLSPIEEILPHLTITASGTSLMVSKVTWS